MGLKDSLAKVAQEVEKPKVLDIKQIITNALVETVIAEEKQEFKPLKPKLVYKPSLNCKVTEFSALCESCSKSDILREVSGILLCVECATRELETIAKKVAVQQKEDSKKDGIWKASIDNLTKLDTETPHWAKGKEDRYFEFFNRDYDISKMSDEELRDSIIADGESLFEIKVKQLKKVITLKERAAKRSAEERKKLRIDDLSYIASNGVVPEGEEISPLVSVRKQRTKEQQAEDALKALGLGGDLEMLKKKFKVK